MKQTSAIEVIYYNVTSEEVHIKHILFCKNESSLKKKKKENLGIKSLFKLVSMSKRGLREAAWMPGIFSSITVSTPESSAVMCWSSSDMKRNPGGDEPIWITV